jgi:hypothetical protein
MSHTQVLALKREGDDLIASLKSAVAEEDSATDAAAQVREPLTYQSTSV